jgi:hypothetical protein
MTRVAALIMGAVIRPRPVFVKMHAVIEAIKAVRQAPLFSELIPRGKPLQTVRHSHSAIFAITSPNSSSAADHTSAETKFAA